MNLNKLTQIVTEDDFSKFNVNKKIRLSITEEVTEYIEKLLTPWYAEQLLQEDLEDIALEVAVHLYAIGKSELITTTAGKIGKVFDLPILEGVGHALEILGVIDSNSSLIDIYLSGNHLALTTTLKLKKDILTEVAKASCLPPLLTQPTTVTSNHSSGHLTINKPLILGSQNSGEVKQNLHFINTVNSTEFSLNTGILGYLEESSKPLKGKDKQAFNRHVEVSDLAYEYIIANGNKFYLTHNYDNRGREYCDNWQVNYQGTDYKKALIHLNKKEVIQ